MGDCAYFEGCIALYDSKKYANNSLFVGLSNLARLNSELTWLLYIFSVGSQVASPIESLDIFVAKTFTCLYSITHGHFWAIII